MVYDQALSLFRYTHQLKSWLKFVDFKYEMRFLLSVIHYYFWEFQIKGWGIRLKQYQVWDLELFYFDFWLFVHISFAIQRFINYDHLLSFQSVLNSSKQVLFLKQVQAQLLLVIILIWNML